EKIPEPNNQSKSRFTVSTSTESLNNHPPLPNLTQSQSALPQYQSSQHQSVNPLSESAPLPRSRFEVTEPNKSSTSGEYILDSTNTSPSNSFSRTTTTTTTTTNRPSLNMTHSHGSSDHVHDRLELIMRQNDQNRHLINELLSAMGKPGNLGVSIPNSSILTSSSPGDGVIQSNLEQQVALLTKENNVLKKDNDSLRSMNANMEASNVVYRNEILNLRHVIEDLQRSSYTLAKADQNQNTQE
ncbi:hypothetical protein HK096_010189, partial [Nowakowskiella sp. JEL0078]